MRTLILSFTFLFSCADLEAQKKELTGRVTDGSGNAMEGVSVIVAGLKIGSKTNKDGYYSLALPTPNQTVYFSAVDYQAQSRLVGDLTVINVQLTQEVNDLKEVVVTAASLEKKRASLGYSVGVLKNDELTAARTTNIANALAGKIPGVRISGTNGMAGSSAAVFIRGFNTLTGTNQPLFVIDGIPLDNGGGNNALQSGVTNSNRAIDLNQDDIEAISVLKGPAAAVLYGSRAASGAIIITTKKGRTSKKNAIQFNSTTQFVNVNRYPNYQNEYAQGASSNSNPLPSQYALYNPNSSLSWGPAIAGQTVTNFLGDKENLQAYPDNVKQIFRQGLNVQNNLSLSGVGDKMSYRLSLGNLYEKGIVKNNDLVRNNISFNGTTNISSKLISGINVQYINSRSKRIQQGNQSSNPFFAGWYLPRTMSLAAYPYKNPNESPAVFFNAGVDNPFWTIEKNLWNDYVNRVVGNLNFKYISSSRMNITYKIGGDFYNQYITAFDEIGSKGQANTNAGGAGGVMEINSSFQNFYSYLNFNFQRQFFKQVDVNFVLGNETSWRGNRINSGVGKGLAVAGFRNLSNASSFNASNSHTEQLLTGVYGDLLMDYHKIISLNLTGRNDWSSTFGQSKRSYFYPAVALAVNITEAIPSLKSQNFLNFTKLFANYARVGKEADPYATNKLFVTGGAIDGLGGSPVNITFPFNGLPAFTLSNTIGDPQLGPEFTASFEIGAELSAWNNRFKLEVAWYKSNSTKIIFGVLSPVSTGINYYNRNSGELETKGWDALLSITPVKTKHVSWTTSFNFTRYKTICTQLADGVEVLPLGGYFYANARIQKGSPYGVLYGSVFQRDSSTGQLLLNNKGQAVLANVIAQIGDPNPDWLLGITNEINVKGFNISFLLDIRKGGDVFSRNLADLWRSGTASETAEYPRFAADNTTPNKPYVINGLGPDRQTPNNVPLTAEQYWGSLYALGIGESAVFDASWLRLRELRCGYTFPSRCFEKSFLGGLEIGVLGRNLFLYAPHFPHFDPENNVYGVSNVQGLEFNGLPNTRTMGFYINLHL